jgi:hypothetical protein
VVLNPKYDGDENEYGKDIIIGAKEGTQKIK